MSTSRPILSPRDEDSLLTSGLLTPVRRGGTRKIHKRLFDEWNNEHYAHLPLEPFSPENEATHFYTIPNHLISQATLRYLGYNTQRAYLLWERWCNWNRIPSNVIRENDDTSEARKVLNFLLHAINHLETQGDHDTWSDTDDEWYELMIDCGLEIQLQNHIMDPDYKHIRQTRTCIGWVRDTFELRYQGLLDAQKESRKRARRLYSAAENFDSEDSGLDDSGSEDSESDGSELEGPPTTPMDSSDSEDMLESESDEDF
ncbi:hypothetical protein F5Y02DRAFT_382539 [Annulohypoxylon stygium]|nr:hypothetical protein F5Y02DRAFT_382539 [Annulohypoxylon stygium]